MSTLFWIECLPILGSTQSGGLIPLSEIVPPCLTGSPLKSSEVPLSTPPEGKVPKESPEVPGSPLSDEMGYPYLEIQSPKFSYPFLNRHPNHTGNAQKTNLKVPLKKLEQGLNPPWPRQFKAFS